MNTRRLVWKAVLWTLAINLTIALLSAGLYLWLVGDWAGFWTVFLGILPAVLVCAGVETLILVDKWKRRNLSD